MDKFTIELAKRIQQLRDKAQNVTKWEYFFLKIEVTGSVHYGDLDLQFSIGSNDYGDQCVKGADLDAAIAEYLHRLGYHERNQNLRLTYAGSLKKANDDSD